MRKMILLSLLSLFVVLATGMAEEEEGIICPDGPDKEDCCLDHALVVAQDCLDNYEVSVCLAGIGENYSAYLNYCTGYAEYFTLEAIELYCQDLFPDWCGGDYPYYVYCKNHIYYAYYELNRAGFSGDSIM